MRAGVERIRRLVRRRALSRRRAVGFLFGQLLLARERAAGRKLPRWRLSEVDRLVARCIDGEVDVEEAPRRLLANTFRGVLELHAVAAALISLGILSRGAPAVAAWEAGLLAGMVSTASFVIMGVYHVIAAAVLRSAAELLRHLDQVS